MFKKEYANHEKVLSPGLQYQWPGLWQNWYWLRNYVLFY